MKTNQNLIRKMGEFEVTQRTEDGMFNATELLKQWNSTSGQQKQIVHYFDNSSTHEFIEALKVDEIQKRKSVDGILSAIYEKKRGGLAKGSTWMSPLLFIDFAMWLNPSFKVQVLKFVYDELIKHRNEAGDAYREMCESVASISKKGEVPVNIAKVAEAINYVVMNKHEQMIRNTANESQMKKYVEIEKEISLVVKRGFIKSISELIEYLRIEYRKIYSPKIFA
jgi:hypothetical protein